MNTFCGIFYCLCLIAFFVINVQCRTAKELRVTLANGSKLVGRFRKSNDGKGIRAFQGIPYAEPPVGELRFKSPVPASPWQDERQVVKDSPICIQRDPFRRDTEITGSEDCLYLNVYTPYRYKPFNELLPVMVFFHGGGFQCGAGISAFYGPEHLLDHDVIYVGVNFRLGPLGFLSTGQEDCPGNFGLKDQVLALEWIQYNIKSFGGNPHSVTVFGESAGGASGTYLMMSPLSEGLFSKVIAQSGTNLAPWAQPAHDGVAPRRAANLAEKFDCHHKNDWSKTIECLKSVSAANITAAFYDFFEWDTDPMIPFPPVIEPDLPGAFITKHPRDEIQPHALYVPFMTGLTHDEGSMKSAPIINIPELYDDFKRNYKFALPHALNYDHHAKEIQEEITRKIYNFYFNDETIDSTKHQNLTNLFTDGWFLEGMDLYLRLRLSTENSKKRVGPTYVYLFDHTGAASFTEIFKGGRENFYGSSHAEELQYLFPIARELFISSIPTEEDEKIRKIITKLWVNFAKTGKPTPDSSDLTKWTPTKGFPLDYYRIGHAHDAKKPLLGMETGLFDNRAEFWRDLGAHLPARHGTKDEL